MKKYSKHIFVCTNQRVNSDRPFCGEEHGKKLAAAFKKEIADRNLQVEMRAQTTSCFHFCEKGPIVAVYPEAVFYGNVQLEDVKEIVESHLLNNTPVKRLQILEKEES